MITAQEIVDETGKVPVRPKSHALRHRPLLHSMKQTVAGLRTVCGRYGPEHMMEPNETMSEMPRDCAVCAKNV